MPGRRPSNPLVIRLGKRLHELRREQERTQSALTDTSTGDVSPFENGRAMPSLRNLNRWAERLGVTLVDVVCFPEDGTRYRLIDCMRHLDDKVIAELLTRARSMQRAGCTNVVRTRRTELEPRSTTKRRKSQSGR
jgi:transcriptional regulator with XRE-family HTH domain